MGGAAGYEGKCDKCGRANPTQVIEVRVLSPSGESWHGDYWCLDCIRGSSSSSSSGGA